jgi:hypothetical protein
MGNFSRVRSWLRIQPVHGELILRSRWASGIGRGNAAAIRKNQAQHGREEGLPECSSGVPPPRDW